MTRKHFIALANMVAFYFFIEARNKPITAQGIEGHIKAILQEENDNFNIVKWNAYIIKEVAKLCRNEEARKDKEIKEVA